MGNRSRLSSRSYTSGAVNQVRAATAPFLTLRVSGAIAGAYSLADGDVDSYSVGSPTALSGGRYGPTGSWQFILPEHMSGNIAAFATPTTTGSADVLARMQTFHVSASVVRVLAFHQSGSATHPPAAIDTNFNVLFVNTSGWIY